MLFNENKYKKGINYLIEQKTSIILGYSILFVCFGAGIGMFLTHKFFNDNLYVIIATTGVGLIIGLLIGCYYAWEIEMKIQEAYWRLDVMQEIKTQTALANKNTPIAKTVVAIENKSNSAEDKFEEID